MTSLSNSSQAVVLQDQSCGENYSSFLDFTCNYEATSGIFIPCSWYLVVEIVHKLQF